MLGKCECPPRDQTETECQHLQQQTRKIPKISELVSLDSAKEANLIEAEVIAIVLYTGPMVGLL